MIAPSYQVDGRRCRTRTKKETASTGSTITVRAYRISETQTKRTVGATSELLARVDLTSREPVNVIVGVPEYLEHLEYA